MKRQFESIRLSVPPSTNDYWRTRAVVSRNKKPFASIYLTHEARDYKKTVFTLAYAAGWRPVSRPTEVSVWVVWHRKHRKGDLDNRLKVLLDALQKTAYEDDSQIAHIEAFRVTNKEGEDYVEVGVEVLGAEQMNLEGE